PRSLGLRGLPRLPRRGSPADVLARLRELLPGVGHALLVLRLVHPVAALVGVAEHLLLLVAQAGELALQLLALRLLPGLLEGGLQLAHLPVEVLLPLGQLAQPIEHLAGFALLALLLGGLGRALR